MNSMLHVHVLYIMYMYVILNTVRYSFVFDSYQFFFRSDKSPIPSKRINNIIEFLTFHIFKYTCRGLYESHKFLFTLLLPLKIGLQDGKIEHKDFQVFIKGGAALDLKTSPHKPAKWITDINWLNVVALSKLSQFTQILEQARNNTIHIHTCTCTVQYIIHVHVLVHVF